MDFGPGSCCYGLDTNSSLRIFRLYVCTPYAHRRSRHEKVTRTRSAMQGEKEGKKRRGMIRLYVASVVWCCVSCLFSFYPFQFDEVLFHVTLSWICPNIASTLSATNTISLSPELFSIRFDTCRYRGRYDHFARPRSSRQSRRTHWKRSVCVSWPKTMSKHIFQFHATNPSYIR